MALHPNTLGALSAMVAVTTFSLNDVVIKFLSGNYPLHEVVLIRSTVGLFSVFLVVALFARAAVVFRTGRLRLHIIRAMCIVIANMTFFLGLAAMPLAEAVALFFITPMLITVFSVVFLGETVGPRRWAAILVGFLGVVVILRPGTEAFQLAALLPLIAAVFYSSLQILTRRLGTTETALTMTIYIQATFIVVSLLIGLSVGHGQFDQWGDPSLQFLLRAWRWPTASDFGLMVVLGLFTSVGGYLISQAYKISEAALVAPFEYLALPLSVLWGFLVFNERPDAVAWTGIALILGAGLFVIWRERKGAAHDPS